MDLNKRRTGKHATRPRALGLLGHSEIGSNLRIFRMEIKNDSATLGKSNQLRKVNTVRYESRNITTQLGEIDDRKSEVITNTTCKKQFLWRWYNYIRKV